MGIFYKNRGREGYRRLLKTSAAETTSSTHALVATRQYGTAVIEVDVTASGGTTPTLVVVVEGSTDGETWFEIGRVGANGARVGTTGTAPSNFQAPGSSAGAFPAPPFVRTRSIVGGGGGQTFTYSVVADIS